MNIALPDALWVMRLTLHESISVWSATSTSTNAKFDLGSVVKNIFFSIVWSKKCI